VADDLNRLAALLYLRASAVETVFAEARAKVFPSRESEAFIRFPQSAAAEIKKAIASRLREAANPSVNPASVRRQLQRYGQALEYVHQSLSLVANADILSVPAPFVLLLQESGADFLKPQFVLHGNPHFNYSHQAVGTNLNRPFSAAGLKARLPNSFSVFSFPTALRDDGLLHCVLVHELGHYVETVKSLVAAVWKDAIPATQTRVVRMLSTSLGIVPKGVGHTALSASFLTLQSWLEEVVCDLFAARLLGPASLLAFEEFVAFRGDLSTPSDSHPSPQLRIWLIEGELRRLGWGGTLDSLTRDIATKPGQWTATSLRKLPAPEQDLRVIERALLELVPALRRVVRTTVDRHAMTKALHDSWATGIEELLQNHIPPGEMYRNGQQVRVPAKSIANGCWLFHYRDYPGWQSSQPPLVAAYTKRGLLNRLMYKGLEISYLRGHWGKSSA